MNMRLRLISNHVLVGRFRQLWILRERKGNREEIEKKKERMNKNSLILIFKGRGDRRRVERNELWS